MGSVKKVGIFCKHKPEVSGPILTQLSRWLRDRGCKVFMDRETAPMIQETSDYQKGDIPPLVDLIIVLGGDGTLLSVARITHPYDVPLLAVNLGSLGFLTEISLPELYGTLEKSLKKEFTLDKRMLLNACLWRKGEKVEEYFVLNDVVINKGVLARIVHLEVLVNNQYMTSYRADGLIVSTPTGSTAYSLSAGGPIIHPSMHALVLSPICPFALTNRSIVIPDQSTIQVKLTTENEDVRITLDGQEGCDMLMGDVLEITKADTHIQLVRSPEKNYYEILREKLHWSGRLDHSET